MGNGRRGGRVPEDSGIGYLLVGGLLLAVVLGGWLFKDRLTGSPAGLKVGDCFTVPDLATTGSVSHTPCTEPHTAEVFVTGTLTAAAAYPTQAELTAWMDGSCSAEAAGRYTAAVVGETGPYVVDAYVPTRDSWSAGSRWIACFLTPVDGLPVRGSLRR